MRERFDGIGMTSQRTRNRLIERLRAEGIRDERVLDAIRAVPRHMLSSRAYEDTALPIGAGQTISQPYVVARMTEALRAGGPLERVLEIGTGCGYQTAILARFATEVYSIERIQSLLAQARQRMHDLKIHNVRMRHGDGENGWSEHAPYDGILVTAAPASVPSALIDQLGDRGRLVIPLGHGQAQDLKLITRSGDELKAQILERVAFVPMVSGLG
jgi:protein-L-isoaspartate(D-aspartate) O-methyltransferase